MNPDLLSNLADFTLLLSFALLFVAIVTAVVDAFLEEVDIRARINREKNKDTVVAEGAALRYKVFVVRHIPSFISAGVMLMVISLTVPRLLA